MSMTSSWWRSPNGYVFTPGFSYSATRTRFYDNLSEYHFGRLLEYLQELDISILLISSSEENLSKFCTRVIST